MFLFLIYRNSFWKVIVFSTYCLVRIFFNYCFLNLKHRKIICVLACYVTLGGTSPSCGKISSAKLT